MTSATPASAAVRFGVSIGAPAYRHGYVAPAPYLPYAYAEPAPVYVDPYVYGPSEGFGYRDFDRRPHDNVRYERRDRNDIRVGRRKL